MLDGMPRIEKADIPASYYREDVRRAGRRTSATTLRCGTDRQAMRTHRAPKTGATGTLPVVHLESAEQRASVSLATDLADALTRAPRRRRRSR